MSSVDHLMPSHLTRSRIAWPRRALSSRGLAFVALLLTATAALRAEVKPHFLFADGMVLQRGPTAPVFGTAASGEKITVEFRGASASATADAQGQWRLDIDPGKPGGPFELTIVGANKIALHEVYVGDVWLCSGQSNMEFRTDQTVERDTLRIDKPDPRLRLMNPQFTRDYAQHRVWWPATIDYVRPFSAVGYFFGSELLRTQNIPIGLIQQAVGGTEIQKWIPSADLEPLHDPGNQKDPANSQLYEQMIRPMQPFAIKGVIWYQGEWNKGDPRYDELLAALARSWRRDWGLGDFPFLFVQLPRIKGMEGFAVVREAQRRAALEIPHCAMVVSIDIPDSDLHPRIKRPIGERLALAARARVYGENIEYSGPTLESARRVGDRVVLTFSHADVLADGGALREFEVRVAEGRFEPAHAVISVKTIVIDLPPNTPNQVAVRFAFRECPEGNLLNAACLPASPFVVDVPK